MEWDLELTGGQLGSVAVWICYFHGYREVCHSKFSTRLAEKDGVFKTESSITHSITETRPAAPAGHCAMPLNYTVEFSAVVALVPGKIQRKASRKLEQVPPQEKADDKLPFLQGVN
uniref:Uncharacterized protein n=1 Tax=Sphaerodactylus townsendi TaxID=933632 RepID=A0ACB8EKC8_9SAUR